MAVFFEGGDDLADAFVHVLDEGDEFGSFVINALFSGLHFFKPVFGRLNRGVGRIVSEVEEEGVFGCLFGLGREVIDGPVGEDIGGMAFGINLLFVEAHVVLAMPAVFVVIIHHIAEEAVEVIKAAGIGVGFFIKSKVPFPDRGGSVALLFEFLGQKRGRWGKIAPVIFGMGPDHARDSHQFLIFSGKKGRAGGGANGAVGVEICKPEAARHEGVEMRALQVFRSVTGKISVSQIIGHDHDDVGLFGRPRGHV